MRNWIMLLLLLSLVSCSLNKGQRGSELVESDNSDELLVKNDVLIIEDEADQELERTIASISDVSAESIYDDQSQIGALENNISEELASVADSHFYEYTVQQGDTLMLIAFKLFRDYNKWKLLSLWNEDYLKGRTDVSANEVIRYIPEENTPDWPPSGNPYLIIQGDYLTKISKKVYKDGGKNWKDIWHNNSVQIKNPNLIFAGFTIYYRPLEDIITPRGPANFSSF